MVTPEEVARDGLNRMRAQRGEGPVSDATWHATREEGARMTRELIREALERGRGKGDKGKGKKGGKRGK